MDSLITPGSLKSRGGGRVHGMIAHNYQVIAELLRTSEHGERAAEAEHKAEAHMRRVANPTGALGQK